MAIGSFFSGQILKFGWPMINEVMLAFVFAAALVSLLLGTQRARLA